MTLDLFDWKPEREKSGSSDSPDRANAVGGGHARQDAGPAAGNVADPQIGPDRILRADRSRSGFPCDGSGVIGFDDAAYENVECPGCDKCRASAPRKGKSIEERFEAFHKLNPQVAERMLRLARARLDRGETFISVKALWEELRASFQKSELAYDGFDTAKLNNSYTALYARLIIQLEPRLASVIELRKRKGE